MRTEIVARFNMVVTQELAHGLMCNASINVKPEWGGDPGHMWDIQPLLPSPPSGI